MPYLIGGACWWAQVYSAVVRCVQGECGCSAPNNQSTKWWMQALKCLCIRILNVNTTFNSNQSQLSTLIADSGNFSWVIKHEILIWPVFIKTFLKYIDSIDFNNKIWQTVPYINYPGYKSIFSRSYSTPGPVSAWMGDRLRAGKISRYLTSHPGQLSLAIPLWVGQWVPA